MTAILEVQHLCKKYAYSMAVDGVSFHIKAGQCFGLLGPNGAGKTTTIEMMEGICKPSSGNVLYKGCTLGKMFRTECGIQFQHTALQEFLSVRETLNLFQGLYSVSADLEDLVKHYHLSDFLDNDNRQLSGGQRQRLLLAIALINEPQIVFLDEPTTGLDPQARHNFWDLIRKVLQQGTTVILSTHYMEEAAELCDEIIIMDHGRIIAQGTPDALLQQHFSERLVQLPESMLSSEKIDQLKKEPIKILQHNGYIEILTEDVNATINLLLKTEIDLSYLQIRQRNLEDLFLQLTGRELRL